VISGFRIEIHIRIHFHFLFFLSVSKWASYGGQCPPSATFPILAEISRYAIGLHYSIIFLNDFLLDYTKNAYQGGFSNVTYTTASLPRQMLTTKLSTTHFKMIGLDNRKLWVVGRSISLTYQIKMNVGKRNV